MVFRWLKNRKRAAIVSGAAPPEWDEWVPGALPWFPYWPEATRQKILADMKTFIAEKHWEGCNGLSIDPEIQCVIASQAAMMLTGVEGYCFDGVRSILVYPEAFRRKAGDGLLVWNEHRAGEAWHRGPIVLSWQDVHDGWNHGHNVVVHELAHHLDGIDGYMEGSPVFADRKASAEWERVARREFEMLERRVHSGQETLLDPYGASNPAEFFAVSSEAFFEFSQALREEHPDLYQLLSRFYNADPASWTLPPESSP